MKILDKYILKSFLGPFFATFFIILFVLVMQAVWFFFDQIAGKGITFDIILKFIYYASLIVLSQALPIAVLLSSIMTLGNLSEKYEFAAAKSAGISLPRIVRSLIVFAIFISAANFLISNYVYPYANLKIINLKLNIKKKQPALALVPGSFNSEIPNYQIKFDEKYGEESNLLKNVLIYDLSERKGNKKIITAKKGKIVSEEGSRYMTLILNDGHFFENHIKQNTTYEDKKKMPASYADFDEYTINIDVSALDKDDLGEEKYTKNFNMLSLKQLKDTVPTLKQNYDEYINGRAKTLGLDVRVNELHQYPDSLINKKLNPIILDNFELKQQVNILNTALAKTKRSINNIKNNKESLKQRRKVLNLYDVEFYNRVALSLSCILLFFIGAPLGSIIRKGGFGLPMILAIAIYVVYFFTNSFGKNLAEESSVSAIVGSWIAVLALLPFAILLTIRASKDKGLFDINSFLSPIINFFKKLFSKKNKAI
ncbi:permease [Tenacibaculum todarodis]|uniref:Permease n=1 Tax=Tenacibaculum todarodis TaxID=1850252 RepID=A0A1L3JI05_9FLAO|nr:LptF/LptG family permease [Tenacibaculum todarodis]APG64765.1 permease [Tenacibaculum todarodis]